METEILHTLNCEKGQVVMVISQTDSETESPTVPCLQSNGGCSRSAYFSLIGYIFKIQTLINCRTPRCPRLFLPFVAEIHLLPPSSQVSVSQLCVFRFSSGFGLSSWNQWRVEERRWGRGLRRRRLPGAARRVSSSRSAVSLVSSRPASTPSASGPERRSILPPFSSTSPLRCVVVEFH